MVIHSCSFLNHGILVYAVFKSQTMLPSDLVQPKYAIKLGLAWFTGFLVDVVMFTAARVKDPMQDKIKEHDRDIWLQT